MVRFRSYIAGSQEYTCTNITIVVKGMDRRTITMILKIVRSFMVLKITMSWIYMGYEFSCMKKWAQNRVEFKWTSNSMLHFHAEIKQNQFNNRKWTLFLKCSMFKSKNVTGVKYIRIYFYTYAFPRGRKEDIVFNFFVKCISRLNLNFHYAQTEFET